MWILYQLALSVTLLIASPFLLVTRGRHYLRTLRGRLGHFEGSAPEGPVWLHAVSVGEVRVAHVFSTHLPSRWSQLVTTVTPTGQDQAVASFKDGATVAYLPFDLGGPITRFLDRFEPRALVLTEGDYWPLLLSRVAQRGIPTVVINGRVGDTTFRRLKRWPILARPLLDSVSHFAVQTEADRERLVMLGVPALQITVAGNIKFDAAVPDPIPELEWLLSEVAETRPILVCGSTMKGEEELVLEAFERAGGGEAALLVIAPRHPERWDDAVHAARGRGMRVARRSELTPHDRPAVVILDSLGELASVYRLGRCAFVGGTLVKTGGHNPIEPAVHGVPVVVGPSMENFRHMADVFSEAEAWCKVENLTDLSTVFGQAIHGPESLGDVGARGAALVEANRGAAVRSLRAVEKVLLEALA